MSNLIRILFIPLMCVPLFGFMDCSKSSTTNLSDGAGIDNRDCSVTVIEGSTEAPGFTCTDNSGNTTTEDSNNTVTNPEPAE